MNSTIRQTVAAKPVFFFFFLTFGWTWLFWGIVYRSELSQSAGLLLFLIGAFGPSLMAVVVSYILGGRQETRRLLKRLLTWRVTFVWYLAAIGLPILAVVGAVFFSSILTGIRPDLTLLSQKWMLLPIALITGMLTGGPLQEELGWRGFATVRLQGRHNALTTSVIVGMLWGLWHLPAFLIPWSTQYGLPFGWFLLHDIAFAYILTWVLNRTRGSVLLTMLSHAAFNLSAVVLPVMPTATGSNTPLILLVCMLYAIAAVIWISENNIRDIRRGTRP